MLKKEGLVPDCHSPKSVPARVVLSQPPFSWSGEYSSVHNGVDGAGAGINELELIFRIDVNNGTFICRVESGMSVQSNKFIKIPVYNNAPGSAVYISIPSWIL